MGRSPPSGREGTQGRWCEPLAVALYARRVGAKRLSLLDSAHALGLSILREARGDCRRTRAELPR
jgi:hypothetical protein